MSPIQFNSCEILHNNFERCPNNGKPSAFTHVLHRFALPRSRFWPNISKMKNELTRLDNAQTLKFFFY